MQNHVTINQLHASSNNAQRLAVKHFASAVGEYEKRGMSTGEAIREVAAKNPASYRAWRVAQGATARF